VFQLQDYSSENVSVLQGPTFLDVSSMLTLLLSMMLFCRTLFHWIMCWTTMNNVLQGCMSACIELLLYMSCVGGLYLLRCRSVCIVLHECG